MAFQNDNAVRSRAVKLIVMPAPASFQRSVRWEKDLLQRLAALARGKQALQELSEECRRAEGNLFDEVIALVGRPA